MPYLIILLLALLNGIFAMAEVALISSRKLRLEARAKAGNWRARLALRLANDPHRFLPTVQIGMTVVSIIAGAYGGTEVAGHLTRQLGVFTWLGEYAALIGFIITITFTTFLTLVLGELVPKTIGISHAERIAVFFAPVMQVLYYLTAPFVWTLSISTKFILRIIRFTQPHEPPVTEDELKHLIEQGRQYGVLEKQESEMLRSIFKTADRTVGSLMTHRNEIKWVDIHDTREQVNSMAQLTMFSSLPVCNQSLDSLVGLLYVKDLLLVPGDAEWDLHTLVQPPQFVPESMPALELIEDFRSSGSQMRVVLNEYGALEGLVTLHDVVEAIFGDLPLATQSRDEAVQRPDGSWLIDGMMQTERWTHLLEIHNLTPEESGHYHTLGGFVMQQLSKVPETGDHFQLHGYSFEVVDMDGLRVDKVMAKKSERPAEEDASDD